MSGWRPAGPGRQAANGPDPVERYLAEVAAGLPGPGRFRADIVAELRSGLLDAMDAYRSAGLPQDRAVRAAIREFGGPGRVAAGFRAEIAARVARRVAVGLLVTGPLTGLLWLGTARASHLGLPWTGIRLVAVAAGVTACGALLGIAATGRLTRWLPARPRRAPTAAAVAGFGAVGADALGLALLAAQLASAPGRLSPAPAAAAAAASLTRLLLARRAARRCLDLRASLSRAS